MQKVTFWWFVDGEKVEIGSIPGFESESAARAWLNSLFVYRGNTPVFANVEDEAGSGGAAGSDL